MTSIHTWLSITMPKIQKLEDFWSGINGIVRLEEIKQQMTPKESHLYDQNCYNATVQQGFDELVKLLGRSIMDLSKILRTQKIEKRMEKRMAEMMAEDEGDEGDEGDDKEEAGLIPSWGVERDKALGALERLHKELKWCSNECERVAFKNLKDGECYAEIEEIKSRMAKIDELVKLEPRIEGAASNMEE
jgi:hypothetical protein